MSGTNDKINLPIIDQTKTGDNIKKGQSSHKMLHAGREITGTVAINSTTHGSAGRLNEMWQQHLIEAQQLDHFRQEKELVDCLVDYHKEHNLPLPYDNQLQSNIPEHQPKETHKHFKSQEESSKIEEQKNQGSLEKKPHNSNDLLLEDKKEKFKERACEILEKSKKNFKSEIYIKHLKEIIKKFSERAANIGSNKAWEHLKEVENGEVENIKNGKTSIIVSLRVFRDNKKYADEVVQKNIINILQRWDKFNSLIQNDLRSIDISPKDTLLQEETPL